MMSSKKSIALVALAFLIAVIVVDFAVSKAPNPYTQPPLMALGSGQAASGAMCATVPTGTGN